MIDAMDDSAFVEWCYRTLLCRPSDESGRAFFLDLLGQGVGRLALVEMFVSSAEYRERQAFSSSYRFVPPGHFYSPIPSDEDIDRHRSFNWNPPEVAGVDLRLEAQYELLDAFAELYPSIPFGPEPRPGLRYSYENGSYSYGDGILLHCMIRHLRPRRIIEVGCGNSSCVTLDTNELFFDGQIACTFIEPYPELLRTLLKPGDKIELIESRLQDVDLALFDSLEAGDILFIDSTHVSRLGSDVNRAVFDILPRLRSGVVIHFHDVAYPFEYPVEWIERGWAWNEQYLLRAFLQYNRQFQIKLFSSLMLYRRSDWFARHMPDFLKNPGGCLWIEKL